MEAITKALRVGLQKDEDVPISEMVKLCAADTMLFNQAFFPKAFRQKSPTMHREMVTAIEDPQNRFVDFMCFRGSAKTTLLRGFTAKRIAYALSRTIVYVSASQTHAGRSLDWIRKQVMYNRQFADTFRLRPGKTWNNEALEIIHGIDEVSIWVIAAGITGQIRGVNLDDYRPDLIMVDDPCDEENTNTPEQRKKTADLFFGSLQNSLSPRSECEDAKMVLAQTVLHPNDLVSMCHQDPQWVSMKFSCFDKSGQSVWPDRFTTEELLQDKTGYMKRNQLSLWMREMECKIVSDETAAFGADWLEYYEAEDLPEQMITFIGIDPASSSAKTADSQVIAVIGYFKRRFYLLEYFKGKGQMPDAAAAAFIRLADKWRPITSCVETVQYQKVLAWYLRQEQVRVGRFYVITEINDKRKKEDRIRQAFIAATKAAKFYCRTDHDDFIQEFLDYPDVTHEDVLDAVAIALEEAMAYVARTGNTDGIPADEDEDDDVIQLRNWRSAP